MWNALKKWLGIDTELKPVSVPKTKAVKVKKPKKEKIAKDTKVLKLPKAKKTKEKSKKEPTETIQVSDSVVLTTSEKQGS